MPEQRVTIEDAFTAYDRAAGARYAAESERERTLLATRFPLDRWPTMSLEEYALGQEDSENTYCRWLEFGTQYLGSMRGGTSRKLLIYKHKDKPGWYFDPEYADEQAAWRAVREAFVQAFELAGANDWNAIDGLAALSGGPALRLKSLHIYFPADILPIYSQQHLRHFLRLFERQEANYPSGDVVRQNRALLDAVRKRTEFTGWSTAQIQHLLYRWADPREQPTVVKIAPGDDARFWDDCRREGYICVGWDDVGDLRDFESKESFRVRFEKEFGGSYDNHKPTITRKANEVWTLRELEPGDIVMANKGTSRILAVGTVVEPGYVWRGGRESYRHTVNVKWDDSYATEIAPQKKWAFMTVAPVPASLYETILRGGGSGPKPPLLDPPFREIGDALTRKGQVILYGPPGTGKTYHARRFAVAWLLQHNGRGDEVSAILTDAERFAAAEDELASARSSRRVWWAVANSREWSWNQLFSEKRIPYRYGRIQRNYAQVRKDDLVVGYQSAPEERIVALARVTRPFGAPDGKDPTIEIALVAAVENGPGWDELAVDRALNASEPVRFRNQGTLFRLSEGEGAHLLALLADRQPDLQSVMPDEESTGQLTRVTFHPSYSYEDFVEGFRPYDSGDGTLSLRLADGVFKRVCQAALAHPSKRYLLLIDEINRANVAKVLGELITLLEIDKRKMQVTLPQSKETFQIPENVFLLGTMNTADRSIKMLDAALRRRFAFIELMPDIDALRGAQVEGLQLDRFLEELNRRIAKNEGREKQIGHSFLLEKGEPITDPDEFARRFRQEILPLLQEFCYDDYASLASYVGAALVDKDAQTLNLERVSDTGSLLTALVEEFAGRSGGNA
jgi:5-methylcytosine-specific restriction protein B